MTDMGLGHTPVVTPPRHPAGTFRSYGNSRLAPPLVTAMETRTVMVMVMVTVTAMVTGVHDEPPVVAAGSCKTSAPCLWTMMTTMTRVGHVAVPLSTSMATVLAAHDRRTANASTRCWSTRREMTTERRAILGGVRRVRSVPITTGACRWLLRFGDD